jgi:hypothetical protein
MSRAKNLADAAAVSKVLRAELQGLELEKYMVQDDEALVCNYKEFLCLLLQQTPRPNASLIQEAAMLAFKAVDVGAAKVFGQRIARAVQFCRSKKKRITSGAKTSAAVMEVCQYLEGPMKLTRDLRRRTLQKHLSLESEPSARRQSSSSSSKPPVLPKETAKEHDLNERLASLKASEDEILQFYGCKSLRSASSGKNCPVLPVSDINIVEIPSSPEPEGSSGPMWFDSAALCMKRQIGADIQFAKMVPGPSGFALAVFPGEKGIVSEMPNLMLSVMKKPAFKRPAAAKKSVPSSSDEDGHDEDKSTAKKQKMPLATGSPGVLPPSEGAKPPTSSQPVNFKFDAPIWKHCKAEFYTSKSYIRHLGSDGKWKLVIGTSKGNHHANLESLVAEVKKGLCKEELVTIRDSLEAEDVN